MRLRRTSQGAALATVAVLAQSTAGAGAQSNPDRDEAEPVSPEPVSPEPELSDSEAGAYALDFDVTVEEAEERLAAQGELNVALSALRDLAGERLGGAWIEHEPELRGVVRLTGPVADQEAFDEIVDASPVPIEVRVDASLSLSELQDEQERVQEELQEVLPGATTGIHEESGSVTVYVPAEDTDARRQSVEPVAEVRAVTDAPVRVEYDEDEGGLLHDYGGDRTSSCTTGFSVHHAPTGLDGIVTAGHCGPPQQYQGYNGENYSLTRRDSEWSVVTDVSVYTSSHNTFPEFYASSTTSRRTLDSVTLRADQSVGNFVCHQGKTTGYSCGNITDVSATTCWLTNAPGAPDVCNPNWVRAEGPNLACFPGDSGGPWFFNFSAYGTMHGGSWSGAGQGQCNFAIYTPIDYKTTQLGAVALTG